MHICGKTKAKTTMIKIVMVLTNYNVTGQLQSKVREGIILYSILLFSTYMIRILELLNLPQISVWLLRLTAHHHFQKSLLMLILKRIKTEFLSNVHYIIILTITLLWQSSYKVIRIQLVITLLWQCSYKVIRIQLDRIGFDQLEQNRK